MSKYPTFVLLVSFAKHFYSVIHLDILAVVEKYIILHRQLSGNCFCRNIDKSQSHGSICKTYMSRQLGYESMDQATAMAVSDIFS